MQTAKLQFFLYEKYIVDNFCASLVLRLHGLFGYTAKKMGTDRVADTRWL